MRSARYRCAVTLVILQLFCVQAFAQTGAGSEKDTSLATLERLFINPPDDARIMMRWWWFGPAVQKWELERELRTMKEGGIGGVEVQPVYPLELDDPDRGIRNLSYLSDQFRDMLRFTAEKARELGLRFDLTLGSGWPYGGPQVPVTEAAGRLRIEKMDVEPGQAVQMPYLVNGEKFLAAFLHQPSATFGDNAWMEVTDLHKGTMVLPKGPTEGKRELLVFIASRTAMMVKRAAVGAEGFVVDHYDRAA